MIGGAEKQLKIMWDDLMPDIYPVWSHRSKRGDDHVKGHRKRPGMVPETWTPWLKEFCATTGLHPKAVERRIMAYRVKVLGLPAQPAGNKKAATIVNPASDCDNVPARHADANPIQTTVDAHHGPRVVVQYVRPVVATGIDSVQNEDIDYVKDEDFPRYPRVTEDQQTALLKPGDRSGLVRRIIEKCGPDIEAVLGDLQPNEQAQSLEFVFKNITQSCSPAVRRGSVIAISAKYIPAALQARKGEPCPRVH